MALEPQTASLDWLPPSLAASNVGIWQWDIPADRVRGDAIFADVFGVSEEEARRGLTMARFSGLFHPDDYAETKAAQAQILEGGGAFVVEHRIVPAPGVVRWVLCRGHYEKDATGRVVVGRGIVIDVTASREESGPVEPEEAAGTDAAGIDPALEHAAELTVALRHAVDNFGRERRLRIRPLIDAVLMEIGRQIAASMRGKAKPGSGGPRRLH